MPPDEGLRLRVKRLIRGDVRADDLTRLFLYARDRCDGRETVQEVGDFVAHHSERAKGIVTRTVRDFFTIVRFCVEHVNRPLDEANLPSNFPEVLHAVLRRVDNPQIRRNTGLSVAKARELLPRLVGKMKSNPSGTVAIVSKLSHSEGQLMKFLSTTLIAKPAFTGERLFDDFTKTLKSHALLEKSEFTAFANFRPIVELYAATVMHKCSINLGDGTIASLSAWGNCRDETIGVVAEAAVAHPNGSGNVTIAPEIFVADLPTRSHCDLDLLSFLPSPWSCDLEINSAGKLARIQNE